jgi:hypothetical protein
LPTFMPNNRRRRNIEGAVRVEGVMSRRFFCPELFADLNARAYRVSFQIAEEGTWDHKFHDLAGKEISADDLWLAHGDLSSIQETCDRAVGRKLKPLVETSAENPPRPARAPAYARRAADGRFVPMSLQGV